MSKNENENDGASLLEKRQEERRRRNALAQNIQLNQEETLKKQIKNLNSWLLDNKTIDAQSIINLLKEGNAKTETNTFKMYKDEFIKKYIIKLQPDGNNPEIKLLEVILDNDNPDNILNAIKTEIIKLYPNIQGGRRRICRRIKGSRYYRRHKQHCRHYNHTKKRHRRTQKK